MKARVKVSSGKPSNGTVLVKKTVVVIKNDAQRKPYGQPFYQTRAQINVYLWDKSGKPRSKSRPN